MIELFALILVVGTLALGLVLFVGLLKLAFKIVLLPFVLLGLLLKGFIALVVLAVVLPVLFAVAVPLLVLLGVLLLPLLLLGALGVAAVSAVA